MAQQALRGWLSVLPLSGSGVLPVIALAHITEFAQRIGDLSFFVLLSILLLCLNTFLLSGFDPNSSSLNLTITIVLAAQNE